MTTVREAKQIAKEWVKTQAPNIPNFKGAFLIGSILWKNDDEPFHPASDVDVRILVDFEDRELIYKQGLAQQVLMVQGINLDTGFDLN